MFTFYLTAQPRTADFVPHLCSVLREDWWYLHVIAFCVLSIEPKYLISIWTSWQSPNSKYKGIENRLLVCPKVGSSAWWEFVFCASSKLNGLESYLCCYQVATPHLSCPEMIHLLKHVFVFVIYKEELPANLGGKFCTAFRNVKLSLLILFWPSKTWEEKTHMARIASYKSHFSLF